MSTVKDWVAKAITQHYADLELRTFHGTDPDDAPAPGDSVDWDNDWHEPIYGDRRPLAHYLVVPNTNWGNDSSTSTIDRSNHLALLQDYPNAFVQMSYAWTDALYLPLEAQLPDTLEEALTGLLNYPIYDEDHYSTLRQELLTDWWETSGRNDLVYELCKSMTDTGDDGEFREQFKIDLEWIDQIVHTEARSWDRDLEAEDDATSVYYTYEFMDHCKDTLEMLILADWNAKVTWLPDRQEGLF